MYQDFDEEERGGSTRARVSALRRALKARKLSGFLVPHGDEHSAALERLSWLTGFTGSAGTAIVLEKNAALFVDGRYTLQARDQAEASLFEVLVTPEAKTLAMDRRQAAQGLRARLRPEAAHGPRDRALERDVG